MKAKQLNKVNRNVMLDATKYDNSNRFKTRIVINKKKSIKKFDWKKDND